MQRRIFLFAALAPLLLAGCTRQGAEQAPPPGAEAQAEADALNRKIEQLKKDNPQLPPSALGTRAVKELQEERARSGAR